MNNGNNKISFNLFKWIVGGLLGLLVVIISTYFFSQIGMLQKTDAEIKEYTVKVEANEESHYQQLIKKVDDISQRLANIEGVLGVKKK